MAHLVQQQRRLRSQQRATGDNIVESVLSDLIINEDPDEDMDEASECVSMFTNRRPLHMGGARVIIRALACGMGVSSDCHSRRRSVFELEAGLTVGWRLAAALLTKPDHIRRDTCSSELVAAGRVCGRRGGGMSPTRVQDTTYQS